MTHRLFLLQPTVVFAARVAQAGFAYPIAEVTFDNVTTGAYTDIQPGMTVLFGSTAGADDWGRQRIRKAATSNTLYFGRSSGGGHLGEVALQDDAHITVLDLREVWAKIPYINPDTGEQFKDHDIAWTFETHTPPPVANLGPGFAATIDPNTSVITVEFSSLDSFAVATGASISSQVWDVGDGTITVGTSTSAEITATFPAGFRYVALTVTDSNGKTHTAYAPVYARDPAADTTIQHFIPERHRLTREGVEIAFRIWDDIAAYPEGTLALFWEGEPAGPEAPADRSHMRFVGWTHHEPATITATRTGTVQDTVVECLDVAGRLDVLPGLPQRLENAAAAANWTQMTDLNLDKALHFLLHWHSTALELADYFDPALTSDYANVAFDSDGDTLWRQYQKFVNQLVPDRWFTCNWLGQLDTAEDPMVIDLADRTSTVQVTLGEADWSDLRFSHQRQPRVYWLREGAVLTNSGYYADIAKGSIRTAFAIAPGTAPGQGPGQREDNIGLARSQTHLNETCGHRYARLNAPQSPFRVTLTTNAYPGIDPAAMTWVELTIGAAVAAQRGLSFTGARMLPLEVDIRYSAGRTGLVRTTEVTLERETAGIPAATVTQPEAAELPDSGMPDDYFDDNWNDVLVTDPFAGPPKMYVLWDGARVMRTADILVESPSWEFIDSGVTGNIRDLRYVIKADQSVGAWLMTSDAIWWTDDIMAAAPAWAAMLTIATVRAADATPENGVVHFKAMAPYDTAPGYLIVATGPLTTASTDDRNYLHSYTWHTHDFGSNWTHVDMAGYSFESAGNVAGYCYSSLHAVEIFRSAPGTIYMVRSTPQVSGLSTAKDTAVFVSTDLGHTWDRRSDDVDISASVLNQMYHILHPFPNATDPSYMAAASFGTTLRPILYRSVDEWVSHTQLTSDGSPTGYGGVSPLWRVNKRTFDNDHVMAWFRASATGHYHLLESYDRGASWALLLNSGLTQGEVPNTGTGFTGQGILASQHNTPNGWPSAPDTWFLVRAVVSAGSTTGVIQSTEDNFDNLTSRLGNLDTLLSGTWTSGPAGGAALPRLGVNTL